MPRGHRRGDRKKGANATAAAERAERTAIFGKTKMCKFYILGVCAKGRECCFAHDPREMNPAPDLSRTKICKTLINTGFCDDPNCKYAHNKEELRAVPSEAPNASGVPEPLELQVKIAENMMGQPNQPGQPVSTQGQPPTGWKPGQQMPPELMQQLASNVAMQMTMLQMAMQANSNQNRPDPSSCPALPLAALTQQNAFVRQHSNQSESSTDVRAQAASQRAGMHFGNMSKLEHEDRAGRQAFRAVGPAQAATVTLADVLGTGGLSTTGAASDPNHEPGAAPAGQALPHFWPNSPSLEDEFDAYHAPQTGGPMPQEVSCQETEAFCGQQDILAHERQGHGQFPYHGAASNLVVKNTFYDVPQAPMMSTGIHHASTWNGSLNAIASQEKLPTEQWEDVGFFEGSQDYQRQPSDASTASSLGNLAPTCEKRMQDTPIFAVGAMGTPHAADQELDTVFEGDLTPTGAHLGLDEHPAQRQMGRQFSDMTEMEGVTVKNTFLEFAPEQPSMGRGLRAVRTAAGRLDSWGQD